VARKLDGFLDMLHAGTTYIFRIIQDCEYDVEGSKFPRCTAAGSSRLEPCCDLEKRWIAVGDAAMAFDPLSSQGMITGLKSGAILGDLLGKEVSEGQERKEGDGMHSIPKMYAAVRDKYDGEKKYYYDQVHRFEGEFFARVEMQVVSAKRGRVINFGKCRRSYLDAVGPLYRLMEFKLKNGYRIST